METTGVEQMHKMLFRLVLIGCDLLGVSPLSTAESTPKHYTWDRQFQGFRTTVIYWDEKAKLVNRIIDRQTQNAGLTLKCDDLDVIRFPAEA